MKKEADLEPELALLDEMIVKLDEIRSRAVREGKSFGFADPWPLFARKMRLLNPQSSGARVQNWMIAAFEWVKVAAKEDRGDAITSAGEYTEVKVTFITGSNRTANFVQLRPYQDINQYDLFIVDANYCVTHLCLPKSRMLAEITQLGTNAHGTEKSASSNINREYAVRLEWTPENQDSDAARWLESYRTPPVSSTHPLFGYISR